MREIRQHGSEGGGTETNRSFLPLSANSEEILHFVQNDMTACDVLKQSLSRPWPRAKGHTVRHGGRDKTIS